MIDAGGSVEETGRQWQSARRYRAPSAKQRPRPPARRHLPQKALQPPPPGGRPQRILLTTLLTLGSVGLLGYTQWWIPREEAQQTAQLQYEHCLGEVKAYKGKHSYKARLAQCNKFLNPG